jgi:hypothetical protein
MNMLHVAFPASANCVIIMRVTEVVVKGKTEMYVTMN